MWFEIKSKHIFYISEMKQSWQMWYTADGIFSISIIIIMEEASVLNLLKPSLEASVVLSDVGPAN